VVLLAVLSRVHPLSLLVLLADIHPAVLLSWSRSSPAVLLIFIFPAVTLAVVFLRGPTPSSLVLLIFFPTVLLVVVLLLDCVFLCPAIIWSSSSAVL
jgi:hypothetical protein